MGFEGPFDLVVDRGSLTCNSTQAISHTLDMVFKALRGGGKFIGIDWFSDLHVDAAHGEMVDSHTRTNFPAGSTLAGIGTIHFCDRDHLVDLLKKSGFRIERLEHKQIQVELPERGGCLAGWNFVAIKP